MNDDVSLLVFGSGGVLDKLNCFTYLLSIVDDAYNW